MSHLGSLIEAYLIGTGKTVLHPYLVCNALIKIDDYFNGKKKDTNIDILFKYWSSVIDRRLIFYGVITISREIVMPNYN